jgi:hypothetical protein
MYSLSKVVDRRNNPDWYVQMVVHSEIARSINAFAVSFANERAQ